MCSKTQKEEQICKMKQILKLKTLEMNRRSPADGFTNVENLVVRRFCSAKAVSVI